MINSYFKKSYYKVKNITPIFDYLKTILSKKFINIYLDNDINNLEKYYTNYNNIFWWDYKEQKYANESMIHKYNNLMNNYNFQVDSRCKC